MEAVKEEMDLVDDEESKPVKYEGCYTLDSTTLRCDDEGLKKLMRDTGIVVPEDAVRMIVLDIKFKVREVKAQ